MRLTRHSFETNSSSTHSACLGNSDVYDSVIPNEDNIIIIEDGCEYKDDDYYTHVEDRLIYAYIDSLSNRRHFQVLQGVVCSHTGALFVVHEGVLHKHSNLIDIFLGGGDLYEYIRSVSYSGYTSSESELEDILDDPALLKTFIFDRDSYVRVSTYED